MTTFSIADRIMELRHARKWTRYELEKRSGVSFNTLKNWEKGCNQDFVDKLDKVCEAFGITIADFFNL